MSTIPKMIDSNLPEEGLRFFHGLSNWVELSKKYKLQLIGWKQGNKKLSYLHCVKPKRKEPLIIPPHLEDNTLYVPINSNGFKVICQLRHAFCHNALSYDKDSNQLKIEMTDKVNIAGKFSLEAIKEFVKIYTNPKAKEQGKKKDKEG